MAFLLSKIICRLVSTLYAFSFLVGKHCEPQSVNAKLFLLVISIGIVAYAFFYAFVGNPLSQQLYIKFWPDVNQIFLQNPVNLLLGLVFTYPDIFESATFSFWIQKFPRPHVSVGIRIHSSKMSSEHAQ